ncbi:MAG: BatD family protein, partial [Phycisphaerales bacterium]
MLDRPRQFALLVAAMAVLLPCMATRAADLELLVSNRQVYVGVPFQIQLVITNAREYEARRHLDIEGLRQLRPPQASTRTLTINRRTTHTVTLTYEVIADVEGEISIPAITMILDGQEQSTAPTRIVAGEIPRGPADATRLFLEVRSAHDTYFLGQTIELTLEIWLLPYHDDRHVVRFDHQAMFEQIGIRISQWGVFAEMLNEIQAQEILHKDAEGVQRAYFVYSIQRTISPHQAGTIAFDDIRVIVD